MAGKLGKIAKNCVEVTKVILLDQSIAGHGVTSQYFGLLGGSFQSPPPPPSLVETLVPKFSLISADNLVF